jgi:hypothetical protein
MLRNNKVFKKGQKVWGTCRENDQCAYGVAVGTRKWVSCIIGVQGRLGDRAVNAKEIGLIEATGCLLEIFRVIEINKKFNTRFKKLPSEEYLHKLTIYYDNYIFSKTAYECWVKNEMNRIDRLLINNRRIINNKKKLFYSKLRNLDYLQG